MKPLLLRAVGPSLAALGVNETVGDPRLRLLAGAVVVAENDNWGGAAALAGEFGAVGAFALSGAPSLDAALRHDVAARNSTVEITGSGGGTGTVLAEIYDATPGADFTTASPRLVNVSVRHALGDGLTAGFAIAGAGERTILIRAVGPTLADFGVAGAATDPRLTLHGADGAELAANDNWGGGATLRAAFTAVGAFPLPNPSRDAALLITLAPGTYTTRATAVDNARGPVLIEIYEVP